MGINEKIKQKKFASEPQKAIINIAYTHSLISNDLNTALKPYKISMQQFNVLRILKGSAPEPIAVTEISNRMIDRMSNASRLVDKLSKKGLAERSVSEIDKRQVDVKITHQGEDVLSELNVVIDELITDYGKKLTEEEFVVLNELLDKFNKRR